MNTVEMKNEIVSMIIRYLDTHPISARFTRAKIMEGDGEAAIMWLIIAAVKSAKGSRYSTYSAAFEELINYLEMRLCMSVDVHEVARQRHIQYRSKLNRLAILIAYCVEAHRTGGYVPPEMAIPELALMWAEGGKHGNY